MKRTQKKGASTQRNGFQKDGRDPLSKQIIQVKRRASVPLRPLALLL
jgi:hypothetical protein